MRGPAKDRSLTRAIYTRRSAITFGVAAGFGLVLPSRPAFAHKQKLTHTDILWTNTANDGDRGSGGNGAREGGLDITHSVHVHAAETTLAAAGIIEKPDLSPLKAQARFALYVAETFALQTADESPINIELIGAEAVGQTIYVYQRATLDMRPEALIVDCIILRDLAADFINNVDVTLSGNLVSLQFKDRDGPQKALA